MPKRNGTGIALLADPTRRQIIQLVALHPRRPSDVAREIGRSRPATSRQLRLLAEAGLIRELPVPHDRRGALFSLDPGSLGRIVAWLAGTEIGVAEGLRERPRQQGRPGEPIGLLDQVPGAGDARTPGVQPSTTEAGRAG